MDNLERRVSVWMEDREAGTHFPDRILAATFQQTRALRQARHLQRSVSPLLRSWRLLIAASAAGMAVALAGVLAGGVPQRDPGQATPSPTPVQSVLTGGGMWPQRSLEELRAAQQRFDAGETLSYAWQRWVDWGQVAQNHPGNSGEIFSRFIEAVLGWESFTWHEEFAHRDFDGGNVLFVRCAVGVVNPLYPDDPDGGACAPTLDALRYETVRIHVAQPERQDSNGLWVVADWELIEPAAQGDPAVVRAEATAQLTRFLEARVDGTGADGLIDLRGGDGDGDAIQAVPLLYATSTGAAYERWEYDVVTGPVWPNGDMRFVVRLFAEDGATVVEQVLSYDEVGADGMRLVYDLGYGETAPNTLENGDFVPVEYAYLDGLVTFRAAYPLGPSQEEERTSDWLAISGQLPFDDAPRRILAFMADPRPIGPGCGAPAPADADALARSIAADPSFAGAAPAAVTIGGRSGLQMDGVVALRTSCGVLLEPVGGRARLYLFDLPGGSARVLGIAISADLDSFETVLEWAMPIVDSIEFHTP